MKGEINSHSDLRTDLNFPVLGTYEFWDGLSLALNCARGQLQQETSVLIKDLKLSLSSVVIYSCPPNVAGFLITLIFHFVVVVTQIRHN